jgi:acyl-CoA synthetase (AMP-forming)/AMP-acid ligase II
VEGSTITIALPNSTGLVESLFAAWAVGAVPQPISDRVPPLERPAIVDLASPSLVVGVPTPLRRCAMTPGRSAARRCGPNESPGTQPPSEPAKPARPVTPRQATCGDSTDAVGSRDDTESGSLPWRPRSRRSLGSRVRLAAAARLVTG